MLLVKQQAAIGAGGGESETAALQDANGGGIERRSMSDSPTNSRVGECPAEKCLEQLRGEALPSAFRSKGLADLDYAVDIGGTEVASGADERAGVGWPGHVDRVPGVPAQ